MISTSTYTDGTCCSGACGGGTAATSSATTCVDDDFFIINYIPCENVFIPAPTDDYLWDIVVWDYREKLRREGIATATKRLEAQVAAIIASLIITATLFHRRALFSKSGFVGRVAKQRKGK